MPTRLKGDRTTTIHMPRHTSVKCSGIQHRKVLDDKPPRNLVRGSKSPHEMVDVHPNSAKRDTSSHFRGVPSGCWRPTRSGFKSTVPPCGPAGDGHMTLCPHSLIQARCARPSAQCMRRPGRPRAGIRAWVGLCLNRCKLPWLAWLRGNHCRQHVAVFRVVVVARAIQVGPWR